MFTIAANGLCCCLNQGTSMTRSAFSKSIKMSYVGLSISYCFFIMFLVGFGDQLISIFANIINCPSHNASELSMCLGISLIVRVSLALLIFHVVILIMLFTRDRFAKFVNEECFPIKFIAVLATVFVLMFVSNDKLIYFLTISKYLSVVFLLYQSIILIDFGYVWNEVWVEKYESGTTFYGVLLVIFSVGLFVANIFINALNIREFWIAGCSFNKFSIIFSFIMLISFVVLVFLKLNQESSILTALFVALLYSYLSGLAMNSSTDKVCNPQINVDEMRDFLYGYIIHIVINLALGYITVGFCSFSETSSKNF